jgi:hypothetical protein
VLKEIVTDNGPAFIEALNWLAEQYRIHHIHISPYNSQANGIVEHRHLDVMDTGHYKIYQHEYSPLFYSEPVSKARFLNFSLAPTALTRSGICTRPFQLQSPKHKIEWIDTGDKWFLVNESS